MEITKCRICKNENLHPVLNLGMQAFTGIFPKNSAQSVEVGPLELVKCMEEDGQGCGLLQLRHSFNQNDMYGENYGYRSGINKTMIDHLAGKVSTITSLIPFQKDDLVLDIGSNDGTLLGYYSADLCRVGIDPSGSNFINYYPKNSQLIPTFFSSAVFKRHFPHKKAKAITSIAMFYDLDEPLKFMQEIHEILDDEGVWVFEQSYMPFMLDKTSYDTICHEHYEYYGLHQIKWMTDRVGFKIIDVEFNDINGGSFSITVAKTASSYQENKAKIQSILHDEQIRKLNVLEPYEEFKNKVQEHKEALCSIIKKIRQEGKTIIGYGASTKGNVILQYCGLGVHDVAGIADRNPFKHGRVTPGSHIPIISEEQARSMGAHYFLPLPWHFRGEFLKREQNFLDAGGKFLFPLPRIEVVEV